MQWEDEVRPFNFVDIIIIFYFLDNVKAEESITIFNCINEKSNLNWSYKGHLKRFIMRFWKEPYKASDKEWLSTYCNINNKEFKRKMNNLAKLLCY